MEWIKTTERLPEKTEKTYQHIECWIYLNGEILIRPWNCEYKCWDDSSFDDFEYEATEPTHWLYFFRPDPPKDD